jgi:hypothetical protein
MPKDKGYPKARKAVKKAGKKKKGNTAGKQGRKTKVMNGGRKLTP